MSKDDKLIDISIDIDAPTVADSCLLVFLGLVACAGIITFWELILRDFIL